MTDLDKQAQLFADTKAELSKLYLSNSENFDKSILAYSTAALGFSLGFLKDFVPITQASQAWLLYLSWTLFVASVVATISSFLVSQMGIEKQLEINARFFLERNDKALKERNIFARITDVLNYFSGITFVAAIICTTFFVGLNLKKAESIAENRIVQSREGAQIRQIPAVPQTPQHQSSNSGTGKGSAVGTGAGSSSSSISK